MKEHDILKIEQENIKIEDKKSALYTKWLSVNPKATWRDVIDALTTIRENRLAQDIKDHILPTLSQGNPKDILRTYSVKLTDAITTNLYRVTDALYAEGLIPLDTKENIQTVTGISDYRKSSQLVSVIQRHLESSLTTKQYLIDICHVLIKQQHRTLADIATSLLHQLGQSIPDNVSSHTVLPSPVDDISNTPVTNIRVMT
uniref:Death domain-containing protein n=1 Tax=Amphimedon queenslandica TaxID=400682 RepID=A0A1X7TEK7_AMPQE